MRDVGEILDGTLKTFVEKLKATKGFNLPRQQFVQTGELPWDCEQLAVVSAGFYQGLPGQQRPGFQTQTGGIAMYAMDVAVTILRPAPQAANNGLAPSGAVLTKASLQSTADSKALSDAYWASKNDGSLASICDNLYFGGVQWSGPAGGFLQTALIFSTQI